MWNAPRGLPVPRAGKPQPTIMNSPDQAEIIRALGSIPVTKAEMAELVRLYENAWGCPYTVDPVGVPQGEAIRRCRSLGRRVRKAVGREAGGGLIGYCDPATGTWRMKPEFRSLMRELGWASRAGTTLADAVDALEDMDALDRETRRVARQEDAIRDSECISEYVREQVVQARLGRGAFRQALQELEAGCRVTGIADAGQLQACHMKPWLASSNAERLDGANGLLLAPSFHLLFSKGYVSFDDRGRLLVSRSLPPHVVRDWPVVQQAAPHPFAAVQMEYLGFHRDKVFNR